MTGGPSWSQASLLLVGVLCFLFEPGNASQFESRESPDIIVDVIVWDRQQTLNARAANQKDWK
jgi:hypothetical protein